MAFYDIEKLIDILVFLLKESYCNPDIAVDVKVKILENENKILKERISSLEKGNPMLRGDIGLSMERRKLLKKKWICKKFWTYGTKATPSLKWQGF